MLMDKAHLVEFMPITGRKHQLRVIASQVFNAPILGDYKYGPGTMTGIKVHV
jgi:23S rRNA-/tRNA-specific pseudouridylate synthase